jgi:hypothetical protein
MIRCGRDADMRSGHRGRRQRGSYGVMIIVDSPLTSAVAGTGSNCARGVRGADDQFLIHRSCRVKGVGVSRSRATRPRTLAGSRGSAQRTLRRQSRAMRA